MKFSTKSLAVALLCTAAWPLAHAGDDKRGLYLAASAGAVFADDMKRISGNVGAFLGADETSSEDSDVGFAGTIGFRLSKGLAIEVAYVDAGEAVVHYDTVPATYRNVTRHAGISVLGIIPVGSRASIHGRLGVAHWKRERTLTVLGLVFSADEVSGNDLLYGAGLSYALTDRLDLTADYQRLKMKVPGGNFPVDHYLIGLRYGFY